MNKLFAVVLLSTLALSATAMSFSNFVDLVSGFTAGLDWADINPAFHNCSAMMNKTHDSAFDVMSKVDDMTPEAFETAVATFGYNAAHSVRVCQHAKNTLIAFLELVEKEIGSLTRSDIYDRLINNVPQLTMKWTQLMTHIKAKNFQSAGVIVSDFFKIIVGQPVTLRRQLFELSSVVTPTAQFDFNASVLTIQGFLEEGNTTIVVEDFLGFVDHATTLMGQFPALEKAFEKFDLPAIIAAVQNISTFAKVVGKDANTLKGQSVAWVQRDLPLFDSDVKITKAVESLFLDLPTTLKNIQRITTALKGRDFREIGHGTGAVFNQLRDGAQRV